MEARWSDKVGRVVVITLVKAGGARQEAMDRKLREWQCERRTVFHMTERILLPNELSLKVRMGEIGCAVGHREAVELAATDGAQTCLVFEDDVEVFPGGLERAAAVLEALEQRDDWDVINLGGCAADWRAGTPAFGSGPHVRGLTRTVEGMVATHAIVYHRRCYERILVGVPSRGRAESYYASMIKPRAFDEWLHQNLRVVAPLEPCFYQTGEDSAILASGKHVIDVKEAIERAGERLRMAEATS